ncbi:MAG: signal peptidase II [Mollicutes bacterium]|nr:signal peptidase II [Mollicutes bacterium]
MRKKIIIKGVLIGIIDQIVKTMVIFTLPKTGVTVIKDFFYFNYLENTGAAFGLFSGNRWILIIASILGLYAIIKYFLLDENIKKTEVIGYSLVIGGILGNLIDRIVHGHVIDFIDFRFGSYQFPLFNIADMCIVIGVAIILIWLLKNSLASRKNK